MGTLSERVALVTGANGGLGPAVVKALREAGAEVVTLARKGDVTIHADLTSAEAAADVVKQAASKKGRLDIVIHVMGAFAGGKAVADSDLSQWQQMMDVNFLSAVYLLRAALPELQKSSAGRVIGISSRAAYEPMAKAAAYAASKAALASLLGTVAAESAGTNLTANIIAPGTIDTPANREAMPKADTQGWVQPDSIGELAAWLCSDAARSVNGRVFPLYGR